MQEIFQDYKIAEIGGGVALAAAGKQFSDFGSKVLKIENNTDIYINYLVLSFIFFIDTSLQLYTHWTSIPKSLPPDTHPYPEKQKPKTGNAKNYQSEVITNR